VPISFTSDHIETLFEIEYQYLPLIRKTGLEAYRCPAVGLKPTWVQKILRTDTRVANGDLFK